MVFHYGLSLYTNGSVSTIVCRCAASDGMMDARKGFNNNMSFFLSDFDRWEHAYWTQMRKDGYLPRCVQPAETFSYFLNENARAEFQYWAETQAEVDAIVF
jgi:hypothetical protein